VLPFLNLSGDPEQAYFAEGMTDQIVTDLARFKALFVLSTESTAKYQDQPTDPQHLNRELGVDYLLTAAFDAKETRSGSRLVWSTRNLARSSGQKPMAMSSRHPMYLTFKKMSRSRCRPSSPATTG
jgi:TolB-like protein